MPMVTLRANFGVPSETDLSVEVRDVTLEYLRTSNEPSIRVSSYLDRDWPEVAATYAELHFAEDSQFESKISRVTPGSRTRKNIRLPGAMHKGEQLTLELKRTPLHAEQPTP